jgi:antitoxin VapB
LAYASRIGYTGTVNGHRHVKLFKNGRNLAVRIPREFELPGDDAIMRREGDGLILESAPARSLLAIVAELEPIQESFPEIEDSPPMPWPATAPSWQTTNGSS